MRCPDCNKFVGLEMADPEVDDLSIDEDGRISANVRIVRNCADCGNELKEATLEMEYDASAAVEGHTGEGHELEVTEDGVEQIEEGGGRYAKSFFGAEVSFAVRCSCQKPDADPLLSDSMRETVAASHMDELV